MATGDYRFPSPDLRVPKRRRTERRFTSSPSDSELTEDEKECILALLDLSRVTVIHDEEEKGQSLPISPPSLSQQDQPLPLPPPAEKDSDLSPLPPRQNQPLPLPAPPEQPLSLVLCPMPIRCYRPPPQPPIQRPTPFVYPAPTQQNQLRYVCPECGKAFSSYQALGGHKTKHRKRPAGNSSAASAASVVTGPTDQNKPHTCSLCPKSFLTGQALGGHMRAHYEGNKLQAAAESGPAAAAAAAWSSLTECSTRKGLGIDLNQPPTPEADWAAEEKAASSQPPAATFQPPRFFNFFF